MICYKKGGLVAMLYISVINACGVSASATDSEAKTMESTLRSDILQRRSDTLVKNFLESFDDVAQEEKIAISGLSNDVSDEVNKVSKLLNIKVVDWLDFFTKWSAHSQVDVLYENVEDTESDQWFENEARKKADFSKFVALLLHMRENAQEVTRDEISEYLKKLCDIVLNDNLRKDELLKEFFHVISCVTLARKILQGEQEIISGNCRSKDESVVYSIMNALLNEENGKGTLWQPKICDYQAGDTADWKFFTLVRLVCIAHQVGNSVKKKMVISVLQKAARENERLSLDVQMKKDGDSVFKGNTKQEIANFFAVRTLMARYCNAKLG
jgi:hypothetical protein